MNRIVVVGNSGSGKTTVSREIGARLELPVLEMDSVYHQENWQPLPDDEFLDILSEFVTQDGWVVDGNYSHLGVDGVLWPRADTIVWLDTGRLITVWRVLNRSVRRSLTHEELWAGNRERLRNLAKRDPEDNVVLWSWSRHGHYRSLYEEAATGETWDHAEIHRLGSDVEVEDFLQSLPGA